MNPQLQSDKEQIPSPPDLHDKIPDVYFLRSLVTELHKYFTINLFSFLFLVLFGVFIFANRLLLYYFMYVFTACIVLCYLVLRPQN